MDIPKCSFGNGVEIRPDGKNVLDPCIYKDVQVVRNVTVIVSECQNCGNVSLSWLRQEDSEDIDPESFFDTLYPERLS